MEPQPSPSSASCARPTSQCDSHPEIRDTLVEIRTLQTVQGKEIRTMQIAQGKEIRDIRRRVDRMYRHMMPRKGSGEATVTVNATATGTQGASLPPPVPTPAHTAPSGASPEWNRVTYTLLLALAVALLAWATQGPPAGAVNMRQTPAPIATPK